AAVVGVSVRELSPAANEPCRGWSGRLVAGQIRSGGLSSRRTGSGAKPDEEAYYSRKKARSTNKAMPIRPVRSLQRKTTLRAVAAARGCSFMDRFANRVPLAPDIDNELGAATPLSVRKPVAFLRVSW